MRSVTLLTLATFFLNERFAMAARPADTIEFFEPTFLAILGMTGTLIVACYFSFGPPRRLP